MASLDKFEGDAVEGGILLLLVLFAVAAYGIWKTVGKLDPAAAAKQAWQSLMNAFGRLKSSFGGPTGTSGVGWVQTGNSGWSGADESNYQAKLLDAVDAGQMTLGEYEQFSAPMGGY